MRRSFVVAGSFLLALAAAACSSSTDGEDQSNIVVDAGPDPKIAECTEVAYREAVGACYGGFIADVDPNSRCGDLQGGPAAFSAGNYGETACVAHQGGLILKCVVDSMSECSGKSPSAAAEIWDTCLKQVEPDYKAPTEECRTACYDKRFTCEQACPTDAPKGCFDCYSKCGLDTQTCIDACPRVK
jgi:hypothetical protein